MDELMFCHVIVVEAFFDPLLLCAGIAVGLTGLIFADGELSAPNFVSARIFVLIKPVGFSFWLVCEKALIAANKTDPISTCFFIICFVLK